MSGWGFQGHNMRSACVYISSSLFLFFRDLSWLLLLLWLTEFFLFFSRSFVDVVVGISVFSRSSFFSLSFSFLVFSFFFSPLLFLFSTRLKKDRPKTSHPYRCVDSLSCSPSHTHCHTHAVSWSEAEAEEEKRMTRNFWREASSEKKITRHRFHFYLFLNFFIFATSLFLSENEPCQFWGGKGEEDDG